MPNPKALSRAEFRQRMVELVQAGRKPGELAREFGCHASSILSWVRQLSAGSSGVVTDTAPLNAAERQEFIELRRKLRQLQQERDILAKATAWFANNGRQTPTASLR